MGASYLTTQIPDVVVDAVTDVVGKTKAKKLVSTGLVSLGKALDDMDLLDGWFGALANRITDTRYMIRSINVKGRHILRNEHEFGAFVQRVYYVDAPEFGDNPIYHAPGNSREYTQVSPYDVEGSIAVTALVYGGTGSFSFEFIRPIKQIKKAFTSLAEMDAFIAGLYVYADNKMKLAEQALVNLAANTGMANAIKNGLVRDLLSEYNLEHDDAVITREESLRNADFLKYASMETSRLIENMGEATTLYNSEGYETYTDGDNMVVEMLTQFAKASDMYLQADTFHNELVALPNFERVPYWQYPGSNKFPFEDCSAINVEHDDLALEDGDSKQVQEDGIIAFIHDIEYVACSFYDRDKWELPNPRQKVMIHGENAEEGYAVDKFMNAFVLRIGEGNGVITATEGSTLKYNHAYAGVQNEITVPDGDTPTATGITFTKVGATNVYTFTPATNDAIEITVA